MGKAGFCPPFSPQTPLVPLVGDPAYAPATCNVKHVQRVVSSVQNTHAMRRIHTIHQNPGEGGGYGGAHTRIGAS